MTDERLAKITLRVVPTYPAYLDKMLILKT